MLTVPFMMMVIGGLTIMYAELDPMLDVRDDDERAADPATDIGIPMFLVGAFSAIAISMVKVLVAA